MSISSKVARRDGFSMIEFVIIILMVGIVSIPLANMFRESVQSAAFSNSSTIAAGVARRIMEESRRIQFAQLADAGGTDCGYSNCTWSRTVQYVNQDFMETGSPTDFKLITVVVALDAGSEYEGRATLTSVVYDY